MLGDGGLDFERDGQDWPNRGASRFVRAAGLRWHVQEMGAGPVLLLAHGTGAATHSWRDLMPLLATRFRVVAPDLPGHGFTTKPPVHRLSLPAMARALAELARTLDAPPALVVGHSAGAAILARMCLDRSIAPAALVSLNGAFLPFEGLAGRVFAPVAKLLALNPLVPRIFAWRAGEPEVVARLLANTGSKLDATGEALYGRLAGNRRHVAAALGMMAAWNLEPVLRELPDLPCRLLLVVGDQDRTVPPASAARVHEQVPGSRLVTLEGLGHLAHEEAPAKVADLVTALAVEQGVLPG